MKSLSVLSFSFVMIFAQIGFADSDADRMAFANMHEAMAIDLYNKAKNDCEKSVDESSCKSANSHCRWTEDKCTFDHADAQKSMFQAATVVLAVPALFLGGIIAYEHLARYFRFGPYHPDNLFRGLR